MALVDDTASVATTRAHGGEIDLEDLLEGMVLGENGRPALKSTEDTGLDFFFAVVPSIKAERFEDLLQAAWSEDSAVALRLIFNTGNCRQKEGGKMDALNFHRGLVWLFNLHPETLLANLDEVVLHGSYKALLDMLQYVMYYEDGGVLSLEGSRAAAQRHKDHKMAIRTETVKHQRRLAKDCRQRELKLSFAEYMGEPLERLWTYAECSRPGSRFTLKAKATQGGNLQGEQDWSVSHYAPPAKSVTGPLGFLAPTRTPPAFGAAAPGRPQAMQEEDERIVLKVLMNPRTGLGSFPAETEVIVVGGRGGIGYRGRMCMGWWEVGAGTEEQEVMDSWGGCWDDDKLGQPRCSKRKATVRKQRQPVPPSCRGRVGGKLGKRDGVRGCVRCDSFLPQGHPLLSEEWHGPRKRYFAVRKGTCYPNRNAGAWASAEVAKDFIAFIAARDEQAAELHHQRKLREADAVARRLQLLPAQSPLARLYAAVAQRFALGLAEDLKALDSGRSVGGLAAKWAPTPSRSHDKATGISAAVAMVCEERGLLRSRGQGARVVRYQQLLSMLRRAAALPESFTGRGEWGLVDYGRMPSVCRRLFGASIFRKHDTERYDAFLQAAREARASNRKGPKVHSGAVLPHDVCRSAEAGDNSMDLQWEGIVARMAEARRAGGGVGEWVPVCDVSGSMSGEPMEVAVALSLLLAESAPEGSALRGKMFTFHEVPTLVTVPDVPAPGQAPEGGLARRLAHVKGIDWGGSTNIDAIFEQLLRLALDNSMTAAQVAAMCVVVFSDMEFDEGRNAGGVPWQTAHEAIAQSFANAGFGASPPKIVYWNLRDSASVPVQQHREGVVLLSGFSAALLETFMGGRLDEFTPQSQLAAVLAKACYQRLRVVD